MTRDGFIESRFTNASLFFGRVVVMVLRQRTNNSPVRFWRITERHYRRSLRVQSAE